MKARQLVRDETGNHFRIVKISAGGSALVESVATKELFEIPISELSEADLG